MSKFENPLTSEQTQNLSTALQKGITIQKGNGLTQQLAIAAGIKLEKNKTVSDKATRVFLLALAEEIQNTPGAINPNNPNNPKIIRENATLHLGDEVLKKSGLVSTQSLKVATVPSESTEKKFVPPVGYIETTTGVWVHPIDNHMIYIDWKDQLHARFLFPQEAAKYLESQGYSYVPENGSYKNKFSIYIDEHHTFQSEPSFENLSAKEQIKFLQIKSHLLPQHIFLK